VLNAPSIPTLDRLHAHYGCSVFFGNRVKKRIEKVRPAKKVEAARAVCPPRKLRIADAVQLIMIRMINTMRRVRKRAGFNMSES
jgi:hypothetical protein